MNNKDVQMVGLHPEDAVNWATCGEMLGRRRKGFTKSFTGQLESRAIESSAERWTNSCVNPIQPMVLLLTGTGDVHRRAV